MEDGHKTGSFEISFKYFKVVWWKARGLQGEALPLHCRAILERSCLSGTQVRDQ